MASHEEVVPIEFTLWTTHDGLLDLMQGNAEVTNRLFRELPQKIDAETRQTRYGLPVRCRPR